MATKRRMNWSALADTAFSLVQENLRVSQRLFENDKVTRDAVFRTEAELSKVEVQQAQAISMLEASRAYFNFLLNRTLNTSIKLYTALPLPHLISLDEASQMALQNRDELQQIKQYQQLNRHLTSLHRGKTIPGIFGVVDYGVQGENYQITGEDDFILASLVLKWTLFQGTSNHHKVQQSKIEGEKLEELYRETQQQIRLEVIQPLLRAAGRI